MYQSSKPWYKRLFNSEINNNDLWNYIQSHLKMNSFKKRNEVQSQIRWFSRNKEELIRGLDNASPYLHHIVQELEARHLPLAFALIPIVESSYEPKALSRVGASGIWQLMPGTASQYGVAQNRWYDGRRDLYDSTQAALNYLAYLTRFFDGDWLLALAAYNAGEGTVLKAIKHNQANGLKTDFWSLKLPKETMLYVPQILALVEIVSNPHTINIMLPSVSTTPWISLIEMDEQVDLKAAAHYCDMTLPELYKLNPGYKQLSSAPNGPHRLFLPSDKIDGCMQQYKARNQVAVNTPKETPAKAPTSTGNGSRRHVVKRGDTLVNLAEHYGTSVKAIQAENHLNGIVIVAGKTLTIPG